MLFSHFNELWPLTSTGSMHWVRRVALLPVCICNLSLSAHLPSLESRRRFPIFTRGLHLYQQSDRGTVRAQTGEKGEKKEKNGEKYQILWKIWCCRTDFCLYWELRFLSLFRKAIIFLITLLKVQLYLKSFPTWMLYSHWVSVSWSLQLSHCPLTIGRAGSGNLTQVPGLLGRLSSLKNPSEQLKEWGMSLEKLFGHYWAEQSLQDLPLLLIWQIWWTTVSITGFVASSRYEGVLFKLPV